MDTNPTFSITRNRRIRNLVGAGALLLVTGLVLGACGSDDSDDAGSAATSTTLAVPAGVTTTVAPGSAVDTGSGEGQSGGGGESGGGQSAGGQSGGGQSGGGQSGGGQSGGGQSGGQSGGGQAAPAPTITSFTTPDDIDCHNGNFQTFTASWTTTNAARVTISIDGPGVYNEYPANGEADLPFSCSTPHSFLLTAYGSDGQTATSTVTLQPRNAQTETGDDTEDV